MMLGSIWAKSLWDQRRAILGWMFGFAGVALVYTGFYPFASGPEYAELIDGLPPALIEAMGWGDIASAPGYLGSTTYGLLGPVLISVMAVGFGAKAIAGSEEDGSLELIIAHPVRRTTVVYQRGLALGAVALMAGLVVMLAVLALRGPIGLDIPIAHIAAASLDMALLGYVFGAVAILTGSVVGRRGLAIGVSAGVIVFAFLASNVAPQVEGLAWLEGFSPFHWAAATATLSNGMDPVNTLLLAAVAAGLIALAAFAFDRRDVTA